MDLTKDEMKAAEVVARRMARHWDGVEQEDLTAELYLWLVAKYKTVLRYRTLSYGMKSLYKALNRAAHKYAVKQQSHYNGASVKQMKLQTYTYNYKEISIGLTYYWEPETLNSNVAIVHPQYGYVIKTEDDKENITATILDIKRVWNKLNPDEQLLLETRYRDGRQWKQIADIYNIKESAARQRTRRVLDKIVELLG